ncbi:SDR family oxidoreductase [Sinomicrobium pectinilyticum]|uniref:SDR family oxidoreductase n=1 Tax=Sinomicrobium pectinilyticum TaxID=1084421 RepID=A0A3N0DYQ3_SINP1|nr:SDR family oxidoreductase [Sinomicrobium pectinilyticum]RNL80744.1 SDR family oxidoreductase [Sinomicrobium pectinilyticum]
MSKTWLITGTSTGLGKIMTEKLLREGDRVFATLRNTELLGELQKKYPGQLIPAHLELTDREEIQSTVDRAFREFGKIDVVVSNAGYGLFGAAEELDDDMICHQIETNLLGSIRLIKAVIPYLRKQAEGHIIQVSSEGGQIAYPGFSLYHATKWGIEGFVESVIQELRPFNIYFTLSEPGPTATSFGASVKQAEVMEEYKGTPVQEVRDLLENGFGPLGDAGKVADAMIACARKKNPPLRLALGKIAYDHIEEALQERLRHIYAQKDIAYDC